MPGPRAKDTAPRCRLRTPEHVSHRWRPHVIPTILTNSLITAYPHQHVLYHKPRACTHTHTHTHTHMNRPPPKTQPSWLCDKCRKIDFEKYLGQRIGERYLLHRLIPVRSPFEEWRSISLGKWERLKSRRHCPFCRIVVAAVVDNCGEGDTLPSPYSVVKIANERSWLLSSSHETYDGSRSEQYSDKWDLRSEVRRTRSARAYRFLVYWEDCHRPGELQYVAHRERPEDRKFFGRRVDPGVINWDVARSWLDVCEEYHHGQRGCCDKPGLVSNRLPKRLRVIDVTRRLVVRAPKRGDFQYVALTYVWGEDHIKKRGWPDGMPSTKRDYLWTTADDEEVVELPHRLPRTIEDAMEAVRELGYRYLWTDALCIVQDDDEDKGFNVSRMDAIYNCAALTIAVASGEHADSGIPGISVPRKFAQHSEVVKGLRFAVCLPKYHELSDSPELPWNTRGWTFQEKILSRKLLLFTDYQVYFRCSNGIWSEDLESEYTRLSKSIRRRPTPFRWAPERLPRSLDRWSILADVAMLGKLGIVDKNSALGYLPNYVAMVTDYTRRNFTNPEDVLPAIKGIISTLDCSYEYPFYAGMPSEYLPKALLWQPRVGSRNELIKVSKGKVPTWSWGAWTLTKGCLWRPADIHEEAPLMEMKMAFYYDEGPKSAPYTVRPPSSSLSVFGGAVAELNLGSLGPGSGTDFANRYALPSSGSVPFSSFGNSGTASDVKWHRVYSPMGNTVGEVLISPLEASLSASSALFWGISKGKALESVYPSPYYIPYYVHSFYQHKETREVRNSPPEDDDVNNKWERQTEKVYQDRKDWKTVNVMLIKLEDGIATRIGVGRIMKKAWAESAVMRANFRLE